MKRGAALLLAATVAISATPRTGHAVIGLCPVPVPTIDWTQIADILAVAQRLREAIAMAQQIGSATTALNDGLGWQRLLTAAARPMPAGTFSRRHGIGDIEQLLGAGLDESVLTDEIMSRFGGTPEVFARLETPALISLLNALNPTRGAVHPEALSAHFDLVTGLSRGRFASAGNVPLPFRTASFGWSSLGGRCSGSYQTFRVRPAHHMGSLADLQTVFSGGNLGPRRFDFLGSRSLPATSKVHHLAGSAYHQRLADRLRRPRGGTDMTALLASAYLDPDVGRRMDVTRALPRWGGPAQQALRRRGDDAMACALRRAASTAADLAWAGDMANIITPIGVPGRIHQRCSQAHPDCWYRPPGSLTATGTGTLARRGALTDGALRLADLFTGFGLGHVERAPAFTQAAGYRRRQDVFAAVTGNPAASDGTDAPTDLFFAAADTDEAATSPLPGGHGSALPAHIFDVRRASLTRARETFRISTQLDGYAIARSERFLQADHRTRTADLADALAACSNVMCELRTLVDLQRLRLELTGRQSILRLTDLQGAVAETLRHAHLHRSGTWTR